MITKETLINSRNSINEALFEIKKQYSNSDENPNIFIIVEGKDDIYYYGTKTTPYQTKGNNIRIIAAGNRSKVIDAYDHLDWSYYSKDRILFIVDRDLSEFTGERTPHDTNIYITDKYAIENELCTVATYLNTLKYICGLNEINEQEESELKCYYQDREKEFFDIIDPVMGVILFWKINNISANYANIKSQKIIEINEKGLRKAEWLKDNEDLIKYVFEQSGVDFSDEIDIEKYINLLKEKATPDYYVRGKYVLGFFVKIINYVTQNSSSILSTNRKGKMPISIGYGNAMLHLGGVMSVPLSLDGFLKTNLIH
ncbi:MAG: DUF4435 domain-containing protein [Clostridia bacterium]|nr:DUF4435 domain-containing protein [Clostridia bacterium]